ncbi:MAG: aminotransferase class V-fold PLP-dependent enzyme, partial [Polyangiaceae bacterium]
MGVLTFDEARDQFPALREKVFLDAACVSLAPRVAADAIRSFLDDAQQCRARSATANHIAMDMLRAEARPRAARLIGAREDEIALVESTSQGLAIAAQSIPLERGDRVLICDLEFMQVAVPWVQLRDRIGIEIDRVPHRAGIFDADDIAKLIQPKTRVLCVSSVQWSNGFRCDLDRISALCKQAGVWLVVDAVQQLGAFPIDVSKTPIDVLACGGHKWLNSPFGAGFLYLKRDAMPKLKSPIAGYLSLETPDGGWGNYFQTPSIMPVRAYEFVN